MGVQEADRQGAEPDRPVAVVSLDKPHRLADEGFAQVEQTAAPLDLPIPPDAADDDAGVVDRARDRAGIGSWRRAVVGRRGRLAQGLVRPLVVVPVQVGVEDSLLPGRGGPDGLEGLLVQGAVEPLEAAVLFGVSRLDALRDDAELDEPDGELRQAAEGGAGERRAVVGADDEGESILAEGALEDGTDLAEGGAEQRLTGEQVAGAGVLDGEGVDADAVAGADPALEVGAPAVVGVDGLLEGVVPRGRAAPTPPTADETGPIEDAARGAGSGPAEVGIGGSEEGDQLLGAEGRRPRVWPGSGGRPPPGVWRCGARAGRGCGRGGHRRPRRGSG